MAKTKLISIILCIVFVLGYPISCQAHETVSHNWYAKRNNEHKQPILEKQFDFIKDYNAVYVGKEANEKKIYLTFDVGYENGNTEKILNVLKEENIPAAFFVLSHFVNASTHLVLRMQEEGHLVCNHSCNHKDMTKLSKVEFDNELKELDNLMIEKTGKSVARYYRPPRGTFSKESLKWALDNGYKTVFWSLCYADWDNEKQPSPENAKELLKKNIHNGAVILLHPTSATNAAILKDLIQDWKKEGYTFASLEEI